VEVRRLKIESVPSAIISFMLASVMLSILLAAADPVCTPSSNKEVSSPLALAVMSAWKDIRLARNGHLAPWGHRSKDFHDTRFEYRWRSEQVVDRSVCLVEIRHSMNADDTYTIPEIMIAYSHPSAVVGGHGRFCVAHDVPVAKASHAYFRQADCKSVEVVDWSK
jgi:hypothetical protein